MIKVEGLYKSYIQGNTIVNVLKGVDMDVNKGEFVSILGRSGSGKSTLLQIIGLLSAADKGSVYYKDKDLLRLRSRERDKFRNSIIATIFQQYHLLPELDIVENVMMPLMISQGCLQFLFNKKSNRRKAEELLDRVGLSHRLNHKASELSGGEMQRVAIARALINKPEVLLADEPTGNLDRESEKSVVQLLRSLNKEENLTIIMVTHNPIIAEGSDRIVTMVEGCIR